MDTFTLPILGHLRDLLLSVFVRRRALTILNFLKTNKSIVTTFGLKHLKLWNKIHGFTTPGDS